MKKKILVDLSILKHRNCGLGQVAFNYGRYFKEHYKKSNEFDLYVLLPKKMVGEFGPEINYISSNWVFKYFPFLLPTFDVWHAIHQLSNFKPFYKRTKLILTIHDFNFMYEKRESKSRRYLNKVQSEINRADKIICISKFSKSEAERFADLKGKSIDVIYNGVEQFDFSIAKRPDFIKSSTPFFFSIGQIKTKKNFHVLLPLMKMIPDRELYIAGKCGTPYADQIQDTIKKENITNVHLIGEVTDSERIWLYNHCEAFLYPSLFEGFGLPVVEAMYFGKPVFTTEETSLKEIGGGLTYIWNNFEATYMKDILIAGLTVFQQSSLKAQQNIDYAKSFSYEKHMAAYMRIYKLLLSDRK